MAFCPEHPKSDQNPKSTPQARRRASPPLSYAETKQARRVNQRLAYHRAERWTITEIPRQLFKLFHF